VFVAGNVLQAVCPRTVKVSNQNTKVLVFKAPTFPCLTPLAAACLPLASISGHRAGHALCFLNSTSSLLHSTIIITLSTNAMQSQRIHVNTDVKEPFGQTGLLFSGYDLMQSFARAMC
jgi:hypothetical protein